MSNLRFAFYGNEDMRIATVVLGSKKISIDPAGGKEVEKEVDRILG